MEELELLNSAQKEAVMYNQGPSLVIAGAGSGKTRVLTYKIAYLLSLGLEPQRVMALTFTNKAAREMKERIADIVGPNIAKHLVMGTFHSIFSRILRVNAEYIGLTSSFTIYDTDDSKRLIKNIVKELSLDEKIYKPSAVLGRISSAKNDLIDEEMYSKSIMIAGDFTKRMPRTVEVYREYNKRLRASNAIDFDDMLMLTNRLFSTHPEVLAEYQEKFQFLLVDEYQDTNHSQYLIIKQLADKHHRVCVVGDDAQSIYAFRGANIANILNFTQTYPDAKVFKLERNYRSSQNIVLAANSLIKKNINQIPKNVYSEREIGEKLQVLQAYSDVEEAFVIVNKIESLSKVYGRSWNDYAVLYRTNAQSRLIEEALRKKNIPYSIYGGMSFYQRKEIKDVLAYLRLVSNRYDEEAFRRVVNYPARGIGETTISRIAEAAKICNVPMFDIAQNPLQYGVKANSGTCTKLSSFVSMIQNFASINANSNVYELAKEVVMQSGIMADLQAEDDVEKDKVSNVDELLGSIHEYVNQKLESGDSASLEQFLTEVALITDQDNDKDTDTEKVKLMTVHAAKGLEFSYVIIAGMEDLLFPSALSIDNPEDLEEERRLLYVAITRAKELCFMTHAKSRFRNGSTVFLCRSRFLNDIDTRYIDMADSSTSSRGFDFSRQNPSFFSAKPTMSITPRTSMKPLNHVVNKSAVDNTGEYLSRDEISVGLRVVHERFGEGVIKAIVDADMCKVTIDFDNTGEKLLLLKFAKLKISK